MLADVLNRLGGIPASRVRLNPTPGTATIRDLRRLDRGTGVTCELIDGTLVEKAMGWYESLLASVLIELLTQHVRSRKLGAVLAPDGMLRIQPQLVRAADVSFISKRQITRRKPSKMDPFPAVVPDLAVEVISKSNTRREIERKLAEYFAAGTTLVWVIDPRTRQATTLTSASNRHTISLDGVLDARDVVPGFRVTLRVLFERADQMLEELVDE